MRVNQNSSRKLDVCPKIDTTLLSSDSIQDHIAIVNLLVLRIGLVTESQRKHYLVHARVISYIITIKIGLMDFSHSNSHFIKHIIDVSKNHYKNTTNIRKNQTFKFDSKQQ
jgi:hypothetical protein